MITYVFIQVWHNGDRTKDNRISPVNLRAESGVDYIFILFWDLVGFVAWWVSLYFHTSNSPISSHSAVGSNPAGPSFTLT